VHWRDIELFVRDLALTVQIKNQFYALWDRNPEKLLIRPSQFSFKDEDLNHPETEPDAALVRHLISLPFIDEMALESFYKKLFDNAQESIWISTPYFSLTKTLADALEEASDRGVQINIITRIDLEGDTAQHWLGEVNKRQINKFFDKISLFEYEEPKVLLHSKIIIVDKNLSLVGSVNLNQRSFFHDAENAMMIKSEAVAQQMQEVLNNYLDDSIQVQSKQKLSYWRQVLLMIARKEF
jgi:phosphatidylserine/phosphatidylglycerophosphate/cardiolipin synthase-like enzyme